MFHLLKKSVQPVKILLSRNNSNLVKLPTVNVSSIPNRPQFTFSNQMIANYSKRTVSHPGLSLQGLEWIKKLNKSMSNKQLELSANQNKSLAPGPFMNSGFFEFLGMFVAFMWVLDFFGRVVSDEEIKEPIYTKETAMKIVSEGNNFVKLHQELVSELDKFIHKAMMYRAQSEEDIRNEVQQKIEIIEKMCQDENSSKFQDPSLQYAVSKYKKLKEEALKIQTFLEKLENKWDRFLSKDSLRKMSEKQKLMWINGLREACLKLDKILTDYNDLIVVTALIKWQE